jgi:hypothetical protein
MKARMAACRVVQGLRYQSFTRAYARTRNALKREPYTTLHSPERPLVFGTSQMAGGLFHGLGCAAGDRLADVGATERDYGAARWHWGREAAVSDTGDEDDDPGHARAPVSLIRQPHGGAIRPPWTKSTAGAAGGTSWKVARRQALELLHQATPAASARLVQLAESEDERVAAIATKELLDRTLGKPAETPQGDDGTGRTLDLARLSVSEREELLLALATVRRLRDRALSRGGSAAIEAEAVR